MRLALKPLKPKKHVAAVAKSRYYSAEPHISPPEDSSPSSEALSLLQSTDPITWPHTPKLLSLLSSLTPSAIFKITRRLPNYENALHFFNHLKTTSHSADSLSLSFQAVLEHAMREDSSNPGKLHELFLLSKEQSIPLSVNARILLMKCFGHANMLEEMVTVFKAIDKESRNVHLFNVVIAGLLRMGHLDDALKLLDEMLEPNSSCPPNSNAVDIVFDAVLKRNSSGRNVTDEEIYKLVSGFCAHGVSPKGFWFTQIITRFCRNGKCDMAWDILHEAMNSGSVIEASSCNALLTGLGKERDFTRMNLLMKDMKEKGIKPNVITYGIMINNLCRFGNVDQAFGVLKSMKDGELGIQPDVIIYNTLIDGLCKFGRQEEGLKLMEKMRMESKCEPNTSTYNCLIDGFCKSGEIEKGYELFESMNVEPNIITVNTLLDGMCKHGRVSSAMEFYGRMQEKGLKGNAITYTTLITAFCNMNNIDKAMKLFDEMRGNGCSPDAVVYYSLISGFCLAGRMNDAMCIVMKLKEAGFCLDTVCYNILINGFCKTNKVDKASKIVEEMVKAGLKPDRFTYNTLLSFLCKKGNFKHAHRVIRKMIDDGLRPSVVTYGTLIQAYCSNNDLNEAMKLFSQMTSSAKVPPNTIIYNMLIDSLCKNDDVENAISLMDDMNDRGVRPNSTTYNALIKGLKQRNWLEKALEFMDRMTEQTCNPDYITMEILTEWLSAVGENEKLRKFVQGCRVSSPLAS